MQASIENMASFKDKQIPLIPKKMNNKERNAQQLAIRRQKSLQMLHVGYAAWILEDALEGRHAAEYPKGHAGVELRRLMNDLHHCQKRLYSSSIVLIVLLFVESPLWCQNSQDAWSFLAKEERCPLPDGSPVLMFSLGFLPPLLGVLAEMVCAAIIFEALWHELGVYKLANSHGLSKFRPPDAWPEFFLTIVVVMVLDGVIYTLVRQKCCRLAPFGRFALLFYWKKVRSIFWAAVNCLDEFANIFFSVSLSILFFSWFTMMVLLHFRNTGNTEGHYAHTLEDIGGKKFSSFAEAAKSYFEMQSGANYPSNIVVLVTEMRWTALIVLPFMFLTFFLFTQLMLAIVYAEYKNHVKADLTEFFTNRAQGCAEAFQALATANADGEKVITLGTFRSLCDNLNEFPKLKKNLRDECTEILFTALDDDGSHELTLKEFFDACDLLQFKFWTAPKKSYFTSSDTLTYLVSSQWLDRIVNTLSVLNLVSLVVQSQLVAEDVPMPSWVHNSSVIFSLVYVADVILRLLETSFLNYWSYPSNRFNFITSWLLLFVNAGTFFTQYQNFFQVLVPFVNVIRILRLLGLLRNLSQLRLLTTCIVELVMVSHDMCILLGISIMIFALIALQGWGGLLYSSNPLLQGSEYLSEQFAVFNFNDMTGSVLCLFNMLVDSYIPEYADAMGRVSSFYCIGPMYCGAFFFFGVNIAFNIFMAFVIDIFVSLEEKESKGDIAEEDANLDTMRQMLEKRGLVLHMEIPSEVMKARVLRDVLEDLDDIVQEAQESAHRRYVDARLDGIVEASESKGKDTFAVQSDHVEISKRVKDESEQHQGPQEHPDQNASSAHRDATIRRLLETSKQQNDDLVPSLKRLAAELLDDKQQLLDRNAELEAKISKLEVNLERVSTEAIEAWRFTAELVDEKRDLLEHNDNVEAKLEKASAKAVEASVKCKDLELGASMAKDQELSMMREQCDAKMTMALTVLTDMQRRLLRKESVVMSELNAAIVELDTAKNRLHAEFSARQSLAGTSQGQVDSTEHSAQVKGIPERFMATEDVSAARQQEAQLGSRQREGVVQISKEDVAASSTSCNLCIVQPTEPPERVDTMRMGRNARRTRNGESVGDWAGATTMIPDAFQPSASGNPGVFTAHMHNAPVD